MVDDPRAGPQPAAGLRFCDEDGAEVILDAEAAEGLWATSGGLEAATVSACLQCRSRVVAAVALVDLLDASPAHADAGALGELADDAPTLHVYIEDLRGDCRHRTWLDPLAEEWAEVVEGPLQRPVH